MIGNHRTTAAAVRALAVVAACGFPEVSSPSKKPTLEGPSFELNAYSAAPNNSNVQKVQIRLKSSSEKSQRTLKTNAPSRMTASKALGKNNCDCQPQKSSAVPNKNGGGLI